MKKILILTLVILMFPISVFSQTLRAYPLRTNIGVGRHNNFYTNFIYELTSGHGVRFGHGVNIGNGYLTTSPLSNGLIVEGQAGIGDATPDGKLEIRQTAAADIFNIYDNTTNVFTVLDGGNVGIGVVAPSLPFEVYGGAAINQSGNDSDTKIEGDTDADLFYVDASENRIGISTTTPSTLFEVNGGDLTVTNGSRTLLYDVSANHLKCSGSTFQLNNDNGVDIQMCNTSLYVDYSELSVGIGVATPVNNLDVEGSQAVGVGYSGTSAAPANGMIIEGTVGVGTASPDASAKLDVTSTTGGLLIPRVTNAQRDAISSPATGLQVFSTTENDPFIYDGSNWLRVFDDTASVHLSIPLSAPSTMSADTLWLTHNSTGHSWTVDSIRVTSDVDDQDISVFKRKWAGGGTTLVDAITASTDGTAMYYSTETTISSAAVPDSYQLGILKPTVAGLTVTLDIYARYAKTQ